MIARVRGSLMTKRRALAALARYGDAAVELLDLPPHDVEADAAP